MCTVTRPGLASIASSNAVEMLVSLLQHPLKNNAPAPPPPGSNSSTNEHGHSHESILGLVPHQIRGTLAQFSNALITGAAYDRCTGCSETVSALPVYFSPITSLSSSHPLIDQSRHTNRSLRNTNRKELICSCKRSMTLTISRS